MCVAFLEHELVQYIFSRDRARSFLSYSELSSFCSILESAIFSYSEENPHYASVYISQQSDDIAVHKGGAMLRLVDGFQYIGKKDLDRAAEIEDRFDDPVVTTALRQALFTLTGLGGRVS